MVERDTGPVSEGPSVCGDGICENMKGEDDKNCPQDCMRGGVPDGLGDGLEDEGVHLDGVIPFIIVIIVAVAGVFLFLKFRK
jgi:hypothetical protein